MSKSTAGRCPICRRRNCTSRHRATTRPYVLTRREAYRLSKGRRSKMIAAFVQSVETKEQTPTVQPAEVRSGQ